MFELILELLALLSEVLGHNNCDHGISRCDIVFHRVLQIARRRIAIQLLFAPLVLGTELAIESAALLVKTQRLHYLAPPEKARLEGDAAHEQHYAGVLEMNVNVVRDLKLISLLTSLYLIQVLSESCFHHSKDGVACAISAT